MFGLVASIHHYCPINKEIYTIFQHLFHSELDYDFEKSQLNIKCYIRTKVTVCVYSKNENTSRLTCSLVYRRDPKHWGRVQLWEKTAFIMFDSQLCKLLPPPTSSSYEKPASVLWDPQGLWMLTNYRADSTKAQMKNGNSKAVSSTLVNRFVNVTKK